MRAELKALAGLVFALLTFLCLAYYSYWWVNSSPGFLPDSYLLSTLDQDFFGQKVYGACPRNAYKDDFKRLHPDESGPAAIFEFCPKTDRDKECPPLKVYVSRNTAEIWVDVLKEENNHKASPDGKNPNFTARINQ